MSVLQPWVVKLPMMQQTVLISAIRGPDGVQKYSAIKMLLRWYRRCVLYSSLTHEVFTTPYEPGGGSFTGPSYEGVEPVFEYDRRASILGVEIIDNKLYRTGWEPVLWDIVANYLKEADAIPSHFQDHFLHGVEILGYKHPDERIRRWWYTLYERLVRAKHLEPEPESKMDFRLGDSEHNWRLDSDPATVA